MYELKNVSKTDLGRVIIENITLNIPDTGFIFIKGNNTLEKTTLLNIIGLIEKATYGNISFNKKDVTKEKEKTLRKYRFKYIGYVFDKDNLIEDLNVYDNITILGKSPFYKNIIELLELKKILLKKVKKLSMEERRRCLLARCLIKDNPIYIMDEATKGLSDDMKKKVYDYLYSLSDKKLIIWGTSDIGYDSYSNAIISIGNGHIISIVNQKQTIGNNSLLPIKGSFNNIKYVFKNHFKGKFKLLLISILLIVGWALIMAYKSFLDVDTSNIHNNMLTTEGDYYIEFKKKNTSSSSILTYTDEDIEYLNKNKISNNDLILGNIINIDNEYPTFTIDEYVYNNTNTLYYKHSLLDNISYVDISNLNTNDIIVGTLLTENLQSNEIVISDYFADLIIKCGIMMLDGHYYYPTSYEDIINDKKDIKLGSVSVNVVGIYKSLKNDYNSLKDKTSSTNEVKTLNDMLEEEVIMKSGIIYVYEDFFSTFDDVELSLKDKYTFRLNKTINLSNIPIMYNGKELTLQSGSILNSLGEREIVVSQSMYNYYGLTVGSTVTMDILSKDTSEVLDTFTLKVVGISTDGNYYINKKALTSVVHKTIEVNKVLLYEEDSNVRNKILDKFPIKVSNYYILTTYNDNINNLNSVVSKIDELFKSFGVGIVIISIALLFVYINKSAATHKKDSVILGTLGLNDILIKMNYIIEGFNILAISYLLSIVLFIIGRPIINEMISKYAILDIELLPFNKEYILFALIVVAVVMLLIIMSAQSMGAKIDEKELVEVG